MAAVTAAQRPDLLSRRAAELGADPFERIADGTRFAQPALYCASLAHWKQAGSPAGAMIAGHSLGELAALVAGGALDAEEGLRLAVVRGRLMEEAAAAQPRRDDGRARRRGRGGRASSPPRFGLTVANDNAPGQVVLSGAAGGARRGPRASCAPTASRRSGCRSPAPSTRR